MKSFMAWVVVVLTIFIVAIGLAWLYPQYNKYSSVQQAQTQVEVLKIKKECKQNEPL